MFLGVYSLCCCCCCCCFFQRSQVSCSLNRFAITYTRNDPKKRVERQRNSLHFSVRKRVFDVKRSRTNHFRAATLPQLKGEWNGIKQCKRRRSFFLYFLLFNIQSKAQMLTEKDIIRLINAMTVPLILISLEIHLITAHIRNIDVFFFTLILVRKCLFCFCLFFRCLL